MNTLMILLAIFIIGYFFLIVLFIAICPFFSYKTFRFFIKNFTNIMIPALGLSFAIYEGEYLNRLLNYTDKYINEEKEYYKRDKEL